MPPAKTKQEVRGNLRVLHTEPNLGPQSSYTVEAVMDDFEPVGEDDPAVPLARPGDIQDDDHASGIIY